jgi:rhodanese-related sulfurtransferase
MSPLTGKFRNKINSPMLPSFVKDADGGYTVLDVREKEEYREGHLPGSVSVPRGFLDMRIEETVPDKTAPIILYCAGGTRSLLAGRTLRELGYTNLVSMQGGFSAWKNAGLPWQADRQFTPDQLNRYSRHFLLPEVGEAGQAKLLDAKVLCIGAGGLGSPTAFYLAAAGVGTIGIVDMDVVDVSNLQRQILHTNDRVGMPKVESAKMTINALNPDIKVIGYQERISSDNIMRLLAERNCRRARDAEQPRTWRLAAYASLPSVHTAPGFHKRSPHLLMPSATTAAQLGLDDGGWYFPHEGSYVPSTPVSTDMELVAAALTPSSVAREPMKKSLPGQETWSHATRLNRVQWSKSSPSSA